jgi:hypothetical protein
MALLDPTMFGGPRDDLGGGLLGSMGGVMPQQRPGSITPDMLLALGAGIAGGRDWGSGIGAGLQGALQAKQHHQKLAGGGLGPASVQEYNFARQNGFKGTFEEWIAQKSRGDQRYSMQPFYAKDAQGNLKAFQLDSSGGLRPLDLGEGVSPAPPVSMQNLGTSIQPVDTRSGQPAAPAIPIDVQGKARDTSAGTVQGETQATAQVNLPNTLAKGEQSLKIIDSLIDHPGRGVGTGASGMLDPRNYVPGTDATNFRIAAKQLEGKAFLEAFETLKGGGAITQIEGDKATQAIARLDRAQSDEEYVNALFDLREVVEAGMNRARQRAGLPPVAAKPRGQVSKPAPMSSGGLPKDGSRIGGNSGFRIIGVE